MYIGGAKQSTMLGAAPAAPEFPYPLWWGSGTNTASTTTSVGTAFAQKGSTSSASVATGSGAKLHTLNSSWPTMTNFALEVTLWVAGAGNAAHVQLWDITAGTAVSASLVSTSLNAATVVRSSQFTLTPGHVYGITAWSTPGGTTYFLDASLIIFPS